MANFIALPEGTVLVGDYRIGRVLGAGGFGITYLAEEIALGRSVTIKEYFPSDFAARGEGLEAVPRSENCGGDYQWGLDRFIEEAQTLARFDHPNICRVYRYFRAHNTGYMVLHFEEGQSLKAWLKGLGRAPRQKELDAIVPPLLDALELIHKRDFLHRDIAPDNIMMRANGVPVLIDFGSARGEIAAHSKTVSALVKPGYSPYEQYAERSSQQGPWTDIYALGATLYHAVTGKRPPDSPSRMVKDEMMPARDAALAAYRGSFLRAIDRALALVIDQRPQSIAAWRGDLMAPDPAKAGGGWLARGKDGGAKDKRKKQPDENEGLQRPGRNAEDHLPPPPDAPGPQGGLLDFVDGLRRQNEPQASPEPAVAAAQAGPEPTPAVAAAAGAAPAATAKVDAPPVAPSFFRRRKEAADAAPQPSAEVAARPATAPPIADKPGADKPSAERPSSPPAKAPKAKSQPPPAEPTAHLPATVERRRPAPRPKPIKSRDGGGGGRLKPLLVKLAIGAGIASAAVAMQDRIPLLDGRGTALTASKSASTIAAAPPSSAHGIAATQPLLAAEFKGHRGTVPAIAASEDGQLLVSAGADATLKIWSTSTGRLVRSISLDGGPATTMSLSGHRAVTGHGDGRVVLWDLDRFEKLSTFRRNEAGIWSAAFLGSPDRIAVASHDWKVTLWDAKAPQAPAHVFDGHESAVQAVAYAPRTELLASGGADKTAKLWNLDTLDLARTYKAQKDFVTALAFSADGKTLASASLDGTIRLYPTSSGRHNRTLTGHHSRVGALAFSPVSQLLASGSEDGTVRIWDTRHGRTQRTLTGLGGPVQTLAFLPDGSKLATAGDDGVIRLWSLGALRSAKSE